MIPFIGNNIGRAELARVTGSGLGWARSEESPCVRAIVRRDTGHCPGPGMLTLHCLHPLLCVLCRSIINSNGQQSSVFNFIVSFEL